MVAIQEEIQIKAEGELREPLQSRSIRRYAAIKIDSGILCFYNAHPAVDFSNQYIFSTTLLIFFVIE